MLAAMLAPLVLQAGTGVYQMIKGNQMGKTKTPDFIIPEEQKQSLGIAKSLSSQRELSGQSIIEDKMRGSTASGVNALKQVGVGSNTMGAMVDLFTNEQSGLRDLGIQAEENWSRNQGNLMGALQSMAGWQNKKNEWETYDPYREKMIASSMMKEGGFQNLMGSLNQLPSNLMANKRLRMMGGDTANDKTGLDMGFINKILSLGGINTNTYPKGNPNNSKLRGN